MSITLTLWLWAVCTNLGVAQADERAWEGETKKAVDILLSVIDSSEDVFVANPWDRSPQQLYYPFFRKLKDSVSGSVLELGHRLSGNPLDARLSIDTDYEVRSGEVALAFRLVDSEKDGVIATQLLTLSASQLPASWDKREIKDLAYELGGKLERSVFPEQVVLAAESLTITSRDGLIGDFSTALTAYLDQEVRRRSAFKLVTAGMNSGAVYELSGTYSDLGSEIILTVSLIDAATSTIRSSVETSISRKHLPARATLAPENKITAVASVEPTDSVVPEGLEDVIDLWVNKTPPRYSDGDSLVINVAPRKNVYLRLYYIQSDGLICQVFPAGRNGTGFLRAGKTYAVGGLHDTVELTISDETLGQETIKAFASLAPIDDSSVPKEFIEAANMSCMTQGYAELQSGISRALKLTHKVRPVAEVKILVTNQSLNAIEN